MWGIRCLKVYVGGWVWGSGTHDICMCAINYFLTFWQTTGPAKVEAELWNQPCLEPTSALKFTFTELTFFVFSLCSLFKSLFRSTSNLIFDPFSWNAVWKITFHAGQSGRKQPAETQRAEHVRCQTLSLNLMPLSLPPPVESNLVERQKWVLVTGMSTAVCFELGRRTVPACVSLLHKCPSLPPPLCALVSQRYCQFHRPPLTCLITLHHHSTNTHTHADTHIWPSWLTA